MPVTMETFVDHVKKSSSDGASILCKHWVAECCDIIDDQRDEVELLMPEDDPVSLAVGFPQVRF